MKNITARSSVFLLLTLLLLVPGFDYAPSAPSGQIVNLLKNGSFEEGSKNKIPVDWGTEYYNCFLDKGYVGEYSMRIFNAKPAASLGAQKIALDGEAVRRVFFSAYVRADNIVPGKERWERGNLQVLFYDGRGKQLGGYPEVGPWTGTFDWAFFKKGFPVPWGTRSAKIVLGLMNASGSIWFDDIKLYDAKDVPVDPYNLVSNGDFSIWEDWAYLGPEGGGLYSPGYLSDGCLRISNTVPGFSMASQSIPLDGKKVSRIKVEGMMKVEDVAAGTKPWQKARISLEFKDWQGVRIGGYPIVVELGGTVDWQKITNEFNVPGETKRVDIFAGLLECVGTAYFDDTRIEAFDKDGNRVKREGEWRTDVSGWNKFDPPAKTLGGSAVDVSFLLDAPAGKHGFMKVKDGHFYYGDGIRARFWGTNIVGENCFPDHKTAEKMADRLAKFGCNLVRMHHMDAYWARPNIFDQAYNDTRHLSKDSLEKFDYFVWQLKKRGIYIFMDLLVDREFKEGDGVADYRSVERGAKICGFYDKKVVALQKEYASNLLLHYNPYIKMRYVDDPAVVSVKLINEAMLYYIATQTGLSPYYLGQLDSLWNQWLLKKYGSRTALKKAWTDRYGRCDVGPEEDPAKGTVLRGKTILAEYRSDFDREDPQREADTTRFYYGLQVKYFLEMEAYLKSIGCKVPISGSNHWINVDADVRSNSALGYIDRHRYWDHPQFGYGVQIIFNDAPMVKSPESALPNNFAYYKVAGLPFVISEWNCSFPNEYRAEGPMMMAAYACLQDWDGVLQFAFSGGEWHRSLYDNFDIGGWPNVFGQWPAAALMFYRRDVGAAKNVIIATVPERDIFGLLYEDKPIENEPYLPLISRTEKKYVSDKSQEIDIEDQMNKALKFKDETRKVVSSDTGELNWYWGGGIFEINTARTQGGVGFLSGRRVALSNLEISCGTDFASIFLSSLDGKPIDSSAHLLLTAAARIENKGEVYNGSRSQLIEVGGEPIFVEGVDSSVTIKTSVKSASPAVYALNIGGERLKKVASTRGSGSISFDLKPADNAMFYEVVLK